MSISISRNLFPYFVLILIASSLWSCQKTPAEAPEIIDPPPAAAKALPQRIRYTINTNELIEYYSFQYDSVNRRINIFLDDTTNTNPYDQLVESYFFNERGFLIRHDKDWREGEAPETSLIVRDAKDQIMYITNADLTLHVPDTAYYSFATIPAGKRVNVLMKNSREPEGHSVYYDFDNKQKLVRQHFSNDLGPATFVYTGDKLTTVLADETEVFKIGYESGLPNGQADTLMQVFLGRDFYIPQIRDMYFLSLYTDFDVFSLSMTDPHHPTSLTVYMTSGPGADYTVNYNYQLLDNNRLSRASIELHGDKLEMQFFYE